MVTYLKTFEALSYERLQSAFADLSASPPSEGGLMNHAAPGAGRLRGRGDRAVAALRRARVIASDETGVRIEGSNAYHWVFRCAEAVVHHASPTRAPSWSGR